MASREVQTLLESLADQLDTGGATGSASQDEDAADIIAQLSSACICDSGLRESESIISLLTEGDLSLCTIAQRLNGSAFSKTIEDVLDFLCQLIDAIQSHPDLRNYVLPKIKDFWNTSYNCKQKVLVLQTVRDALIHVCNVGPFVFLVVGRKDFVRFLVEDFVELDTALGIYSAVYLAKVRAPAIHLLSTLVKLGAGSEHLNDLAIPDTVKVFVAEIRRNVKKLPVTVKLPLYGLLGEVAERAPLLIEDDADSIFRVFMSEMQTEMNSKDPKFLTIAGCFNGINGLLFNFSRLPVDVSRYAMIFAALKLIEMHCGEFTTLLLTQKSGYCDMYADLTYWASHPSNRDAQKLGYRARDAFLKEISRSLVVSCKQKMLMETCKAAFSFFIKEFNAKIKTADTARDLTLAVRGYGYFTAPALLLSSSESVNDMFKEMIYKCEQMFFSMSPETMEDKLTNLPGFVDTLAMMISDGGIGLPDVFQFAIQRLCVLVIESFPRLGPPQQHFGAQAIVKTFLVVSRSSVSAKDILSDIVYEGLVRTCSFPIPPESPEADAFVGQRKATTYKDFSPLWEKLVGCEYMKDLMSEVGASEVDLRNTARLIFDELMEAALRINDSLNFELLSTVSEEEAITADIMALDKKPTKEQDFQIFFSLEQLLNNVISNAKPHVASGWSTKFCEKVMILSNKNPLIGGLYRLLSIWWKFDRNANKRDKKKPDGDVSSADSQDDIEMKEVTVLPNATGISTVVTFIRELTGRIQHFSDEVLFSAVQAILDAPVDALIHSNELLVEPLILALQTGKSDLTMAEAAVNALQRWCIFGEMPLKLSEPLFPRILPHLDSYLRGTTIDVMERSKINNRRKRHKISKNISADEAALDLLRERILIFLGALGGKYNRFLLGSNRLDDVRNLAISWDMEQHLKFRLPFGDIALDDFYLDDLQSRITDLCLHSPDRPTKVAACECLHAMTISLIGNHAFTMENRDTEKTTLVNLIRKLMPKLLELACDPEPVTKQIIEPLVLQMIRWYAQKAAKLSAESTAMLDCIMDGLVSERNPVVRDFCARCAREFLEFSLKERRSGEISVSTAVLLDRIISFSGHSSSAKRFGAALAFNQCYRIFREDWVTVDIYGICLIVAFTKSLALSHRDNQGSGSGKMVESSLDHMGRIVEKYAKKMDKVSERRKNPVELLESTLTALVDWLVLQCCRAETFCRMKCWSLVGKILNAQQMSAADYFANLSEAKGKRWLLQAFLSGGFDPDKQDDRRSYHTRNLDSANRHQELHSLERLAASLDCFAWSLKENYLSPEFLKVKEWEQFAIHLSDFVAHYDRINSTDAVLDPKVLAIRRSRCGILVRLTDLIRYFLTKDAKGTGGKIAHEFLSEKFLSIVVLMTLNPFTLGFDMNQDVKTGLEKQMRDFLILLRKMADPKLVIALGKAFTSYMEEEADIARLVHEGCVTDRGIVDGYIVLHQTGFDSDYLRSKKISADNFANLMMDFVGASLTTKFRQCGSQKSAWLATNVIRERMVFDLGLYYHSNLEVPLSKFIFIKGKREVFYPKLKKGVFKYIFDLKMEHRLEVQGEFLNNVFAYVRRDEVNETLKDALEYMIGHRSVRKSYGEKFCEVVMQHYGQFLQRRQQSTLHSLEDDRLSLDVVKLVFLIHPSVIKITSESISEVIDFYTAVLTQQIGGDQSVLSLKNQALRLLMVFLTGVESEKVEEAVQHMYVNDFPVCASELTKESIQSSYYLQAVDLIVHAVALCGNRAVFEICVKLVCRDENHPLIERFQKMFETICVNEHGEEVQNILETPWKIFTNAQYAIKHREIAAEKILLAMLRSAAVTALIAFSSNHLSEIVEILETKQRVVTKELLVSQKCCFQVCEVLCTVLPKSELVAPNSHLTLAFWNHRKKTNSSQDKPKGSELIQFLCRTADSVAHENAPPEIGLEDVQRKLHCAAYRLSVAGITATQIDLKFYFMCFFEEKPEKGRILWTNFIDVEKTYEFPVEFAAVPRKKRQLAAIHREIGEKSGSMTQSSFSAGIFTITSYASGKASATSLLQGSSLGDELSRFDYSNGTDSTVSPLSASKFGDAETSKDLAETVDLEMDEFNLHECMPTLVALVQHMVDKHITPVEGQAPNWVTAIKKQLEDPKSARNVKLFLVKLMVNVESRQPYFEMFAEELYASIINMVLQFDCSEGLNYFVLDMIQMMLRWTLKHPPNELDQHHAQKLFEYVIKNIRHSNSQVQRNNLTVLKVLAEAWKSLLYQPAGGIVTSLLTNDPTKAKLNIAAINVIAISLDALPFTMHVFEEYRRILVLHLKTSSKPVYTVAAVTLGLLLSRASESGCDENKIGPVVAEVDLLLMAAQDKDKDKFLSVVHEMQKSYRKIGQRHWIRISYMVPLFHGDIKARCLEIFIGSAQSFEDPFKEAQSAKLNECLSDRSENVQGLALQLFKSIFSKISVQQFKDLFPDLADLIAHRSPLLRQQVYDFCMMIYERFENGITKPEKDLLHMARSHLFAGLKDKDKMIRDHLVAFWAQEKRFSGSTFTRLITIFDNLLEPELQSTFLPTCCHLLLDLCHKTPQFGQPFFPHALSDCEFFRQEIETSWRQRSTLAPVTAHTYASGTFSGTYGSARVGERALVFTPTQVAADTATDTLAGVASYAYGSQFSQSLMVNLPRRDLLKSATATQLSQEDVQKIEYERSQKEVEGLRRRFQRDNQAKSNIFFARRELSQQKQREEMVKMERERRNLDVKLSRMYRVGDVPDILITHSAVIQPLQTLSQHDNHTASILLTRIFRGIVQEARKNRDEVDKDLERLSKKLEGILKDERVSDVMFLTTLLSIVSTEDLQFLLWSLLYPYSDINDLEHELLQPESVADLAPRTITEQEELNRPLPYQNGKQTGSTRWTASCGRYSERVSRNSCLQETVSPDAITLAATKSVQPHLGIAVIESAMLRVIAEPRPKKGRQQIANISHHSLGLFQLLESIDEIDSIRGLNLGQIFRKSAEVGTAIDAITRSDFSAAASIYASLYDDEHESKPVLQLLRDSYMRCLDELGRWKDLEDVAVPSGSDERNLEGLEVIWENPQWVESLLPFAIKSRIKMCLDNGQGMDSFDTFLLNAHEVSARRVLLERRFSFELALFRLCEEKKGLAEELRKRAVTYLLQDWAGTSQLNFHSRERQLPKMQLLEELRAHIEMLTRCELNPSEAKWYKEAFVEFLVNGDREPALVNPVSFWNDVISNRCFFVDKMDKTSANPLPKDLTGTFFIHEKLRIASVAVTQHNFRMADHILSSTATLARSTFPNSKYFSTESGLPRLQDRWCSAYILGAIERARWYSTSSEAEASLKKLFAAYDLTEKLAAGSSSQTRPVIRFMAIRVLDAVADLLFQHGSSISLDSSKQKLLNLRGDNSDLRPLITRIFSDLRVTCSHFTESDTAGGAMLEEFRFCDKSLGKNLLPTSELVQAGTVALLKSMKLGIVAARDLFSRILVWLSEYPEITESFVMECQDVPTWMFLSWASQMLALVDKREGAAVHDVLGRLADEYPQALVYAFKISREGYVLDDKSTHGKVNRPAADNLAQKLDLPLVSEFVRQLEQMYEPQSFFLDFTKKAEYMLKEKKHEQLQREFEEIYGKLFSDQAPSLNSTWRNFVKDSKDRILSVFGTHGKKIAKMKYSQFKTEKQRLEDWFKQYGAGKKSGSNKLVDYNSWLAEFSALNFENGLEVPGQYNGREKPIPERHVKISSFGEEVLVLQSIRKPVRIVIRGDDEKDYPFLVKGGEDLRLDQRIEQLFVLMNRIFDQDADCAKRNLRITTYEVVPMTTQVGLIAWVNSTTTLKSFLTKNQKNADKLLTESRQDMLDKISKNLPGRRNNNDPPKVLYQQSYLHINSAVMRSIFESCEQKLDPYLLRKQLQRLTVSAEAFVMVRNIFAETYAAFSIAQWLLGIGDRHLSNYLLATDTGNIFPIDFGHAFGSAVQFLPIPELVPIRLTRQFVKLLAPLTVNGKLKQTMVHALRALRKDKQILLATMNIFVLEPSVDWLQNARKSAPSDDSPADDLLWYPRDKIAIAERKMCGGNPAYITRDEVRRSAVLSGDILKMAQKACIGDEECYRSQQSEDNLSVETQVDCLIDQATDGNLLGRMFFGWEPWV